MTRWGSDGTRECDHEGSDGPGVRFKPVSSLPGVLSAIALATAEALPEPGRPDQHSNRPFRNRVDIGHTMLPCVNMPSVDARTAMNHAYGIDFAPIRLFETH